MGEELAGHTGHAERAYGAAYWLMTEARSRLARAAEAMAP